MAPSTNADTLADLSIANSDLDTAADFARFSVNREATVESSSSIAHSGYEGIDWNRLPGYLASRQRRRQRTGWVWEHGYDVENDSSGHRFWLCKECHQRRLPSPICTMLRLRAKPTVIWKMSTASIDAGKCRPEGRNNVLSSTCSTWTLADGRIKP